MKRILNTPSDALGALFFLPGQYLFKRFEAGRETTKALSSEQIARAFRDYRIDYGWITRTILRYREEPEGNYILSVKPAGIRTILVETEGREVVEMRLPLPTLILFGHRNDFYLWATKSKTVNQNSKLCAVPLPNIGGNGSGKICFGSNEVLEARVETIDAVWKLIFQTPFNGDHSANKCKSAPKDVRRFLFALANKNAKRFPNSELLEINATVDELWTQAVERNNS